MKAALFNPGTLRHRIVLQSFTVTRASDGGELKAWTDKATVFAEIKFGAGRELSEFGTGKEFFGGKEVNADLALIITIRYYPLLTSQWRITFADPLAGGAIRYFDIESIADLTAARQYQRVYCRELVGKEVQT